MKSLKIYLISGPIGAGKSSLSKMINQKLGYVLVIGDEFFVPLEKDKNLSWANRLRVSWQNIVSDTRESLSQGKNVVIDFVVEDELSWFLEQVSDFDVQVSYVVLVTTREEIARRLKERDGGTQFLQRATVLLEQLQNEPKNKSYIVDTTGKSTDEVFDEVVSNKKKFVLT